MTRTLAIIWLLAGLLAPAVSHAQRWEEAWQLLKMKQADTARKVADVDVSEEPGRSTPMSWYVRGMVYKTLYDSEEYQERYQAEHVDLHAFDSYLQAMMLDKKNELSSGILEDVLQLTEDFAQVGLDLFEKAYEKRDASAMVQAVRYLDNVEAGFSVLGPRQVPLHKTLGNFGIDKKTLDVCRALAKDAAGHHDEAAQLYEKLVREKTVDPTVYLNLKDYYLLRGRRGKALNVLEIGRKMAPKSLDLSLAYAEILADTGRASEGLQIAITLARTQTDEPAPLASAGFIEEKKGNYDKAESYYQNALALEPTDFTTNFRLGKLYFKRAEDQKGRKATLLYIKELQEQSLKYAEVAGQQDPHHPGNLRILFELYTALGQSEKAQLIKTAM